MDYAITNYSEYVLSDGTYRVAKLNNVTKRPVLLANFNRALQSLKAAPSNMNSAIAKAAEEVKNVGSSSHSYDIVLGRLAMTTESFDHSVNVDSYRKLKVNNIVNTKVSNVYNSEMSKKEEKRVEVSPVETKEPEKELTMEIPLAQEVVPPKEEVQEFHYSLEPEMPTTTRSSRLDNNIINKPDRFKEPGEIKMPEPPKDENVSRDFYGNITTSSNTTFPTRSERMHAQEEKSSTSAFDAHSAYKGELVVGRDREYLDKIDRINDKNDRTDRTDRTANIRNTAEALQEAYDKFSRSEQKKKAAIDEVLRLEKKVKEAKAMLEEKMRRRAEKIADLNSKIDANDEETQDYTLHSADLQKQLQEYMEQLNDGSFDYDEESSRRMRRAG